jgi:hypothetical protein
MKKYLVNITIFGRVFFNADNNAHSVPLLKGFSRRR